MPFVKAIIANNRPTDSNDLVIFRRQAIKAAKDLCYGDEVIEKLKAATTINEVDRTMRTARKEKFK